VCVCVFVSVSVSVSACVHDDSLVSRAVRGRVYYSLGCHGETGVLNSHHCNYASLMCFLRFRFLAFDKSDATQRNHQKKVQ